jgi:hypothetical protein
MESYSLLATIGGAVSVALTGVAFVKRFRAYALAVLFVSLLLALGVINSLAVGEERNLVTHWPLLLLIVLAFQVVLLPIVTCVYLYRAHQKSDGRMPLSK